MVHRPAETASPLEAALGQGWFDRVRADWTDPGWWGADIRSEVVDMMRLAPGPELLQSLIALGCGDCPMTHVESVWGSRQGRAGTPCACQVVISTAWQAQTAWTAVQSEGRLIDALGPASKQVPLDEFSAGRGTITDPGVEELAPGLRCSADSLRRRIAKARELWRHPQLRHAVASGLLADWHAHLILSDLQVYPEPVVDQVVEELLGKLRGRQEQRLRPWTFSEVRRAAVRTARRLDHRPTRKARDDARHRRNIRLHHTGPGAARVIAELSDADAVRTFHRVSAIARGILADAGPEETRSLEQVRTDVFLDLLLHGTSRDENSHENGEVAVVADLTALLAGDGEATLPDGSPVEPAVARELAADRKWRLWLRDGSGRIVATSPTTYRPTVALARLIRARDVHCRYPGCRVAAANCDLDHVVPFPQGKTVPDNLGALCRRHHRLKTHAGWDLDTDEHHLRWRSPAGITYQDRS